MAMFAKHLKLERDVIEQLTLGAFLHDVGEVFIPNDILNKKGELTEKEHKIVKTHVALGAEDFRRHTAYFSYRDDLCKRAP